MSDTIHIAPTVWTKFKKQVGETMTLKHLGWFVGVSAAAFSTPSLAQESAPQARPSSQTVLEEIIVTAEKREQRLQDVPMSIAAFSADQITKTRMNDLSSVARRTPNFVAALPEPTQPRLSIRGIGTNDREAGSDSSVVLFLDEEYIGRPGASSMDLFDVERVEVLRGPQGTLFGRNVTGGAVSITTKKPVQEFEGSAEVTVGNLALFEGRGMINAPLTDDSALRVAVSARTRHGAYHNVFLGNQRVQDTDQYGARVQYAFKISDDVRGLLGVDFSQDKIAGLPSRLVQGKATDAAFQANLVSLGARDNPYVVQSLSPYQVANNILGDANRKSAAGKARLEWNLGPATATLLTTYRTNHLIVNRDAGGVPIMGSGPASLGFSSMQNVNEDYTAFSSEARLASNSDADAKLRWIAGAYYLDERVSRNVDARRQANNSYSAPYFLQDVNARSIAGFAEATWRPVEHLEFVVGGRYTHDTKDYRVAVVDQLTPAQRAQITAQLGRPPSLTPALQTYDVGDVTKSSEFTPKVSARYIFSPNANVYVLFSKGYKSGGFVGTAATPAAALTTFRPEHVKNLEAGFKGRFLSNRAAVNLSVFSMRYTDLQLASLVQTIPGVPTSVLTQVTNAAGAKIDGAEADFSLAATEGLTLYASGSLLDAKVDEVIPGSTLLVGKPLPDAPKRQLNLGAEYAFAIADGRASARLDYLMSSHSYTDVNAPASGYVEPHELLEARLSYTPDGGRWNVAVWGKNLTGTTYLLAARLVANGNAGFGQFNEPRTYGVTLGAKF